VCDFTRALEETQSWITTEVLLPLQLLHFWGLIHCSKCSLLFQATVNQRLVGQCELPTLKRLLSKAWQATMLSTFSTRGMGDHAATYWGGRSFGCKSLSPPFMFLTDLGLSRATGWITTQCVQISKPLAISAMARTKSVVAATGQEDLPMWLLRWSSSLCAW